MHGRHLLTTNTEYLTTFVGQTHVKCSGVKHVSQRSAKKKQADKCPIDEIISMSQYPLSNG